jgi:hypothetical protein
MPTKQERFDQDLNTITFLVNAGQSDLRMDAEREDANETIYFARQLEYVRSRVYDIKRPKPSALERFPIDSEAPEWAETITYTMYDATGIAKIIASYADDLPMVGISGQQFSSPVRSLGIAYGWSTAEIRAASQAKLNLKTEKALMARKGNDFKVNQIAWFGDTVSGLPGFLTNANIPAYTVPADGTGASKLWSNKTADQIIRDMNGIVNQVKTQTVGVHKATELWLPITQATYIGSVPRSSTSDTTIREFFTKNNPGVTIHEIPELTNVSVLSNLNVMVAIENNLENLELILPMAFREYPPQVENLSWKVPAESRSGGVVIRYPLAMALGTGI